MHLMTRKSCLKIVVKFLRSDNDLHFRRVIHSTRLQNSVLFFVSETISKIRSKLIQNVNNIDIYTDGEPQTCLRTVFEPATETEIGVLLKSSPIKSCERDPIPTWLRRDCAHDILYISLRTGIMPSHLKGAHVRPVIKKPSLDKGILKNYRPVSYLSYNRTCCCCETVGSHV